MIKQFAANWVSWGLKNAGFDAHGWMRAAMRKPRFDLAPGVQLARKLCDPRRHVFFGYYDITPFSHDGSRILAGRVDRSVLSPQPESICEVGFYAFDEPNEFIPLGETTTWCWQQGLRLQWMPGSDSKRVVFNRLIDGRHGAVVQDAETRNQDVETHYNAQTYSRSLYAVGSDGRYGLSLNFARLHRLRPGYGYRNALDVFENENAPGHDGLWRIGLQSGEERLLISLKEIANDAPHESMAGAEHYLNHLSFNPSASRIVFFHIWKQGKQRWMRMITCDLEGGERCALANEGHVSHFDWKNDKEILAYSTHRETGRRFHLYRDKTNERRVVGEGALIEDSHPSFSPCGRYLLMDSYPDGYRDQHLFLFDLAESKRIPLGRFYAPVNYDETQVRCDLHPRWSPCGNLVCVDSVCDGRRAMYILDVSSVKS